MSRENENAQQSDQQSARTPARGRQPDDGAPPEAEPQDGSLKVHGDKYERALDDSRQRSPREE